MNLFLLLISLFTFSDNLASTDIIEVGRYENDSYIFTYGQVYQDDDDIDGAIYIEDKNYESSNVLIEYDDLGVERIIYLADVGSNEFIVVCERYEYSEDFQLPKFKDVVLIKYDIKGNYVDSISYNEPPAEYRNHNYFLVIVKNNGDIEYIDNDLSINNTIEFNTKHLGVYSDQYQGELYVNEILNDILYLDFPGLYTIRIVDDSYEFTYQVEVMPVLEVFGNQYYDMYIDYIFVRSLGEVYVNDALYNDEIITVPGNYTVSVYGVNNYVYRESFVLLPNITFASTSGIEDFIEDMTVYESIRIYSNGISMLLDGEPYNSEIITKIGGYVITIYGVNGMQYSLNFSILSSYSGVNDGGVYNEVNLTVYGEALLNGETIQGSKVINTPGDYKLEIISNDEISETIYFTIEALYENDEETQIASFNYNYIILAIIAVGLYIFFRKK